MVRPSKMKRGVSSNDISITRMSLIGVPVLIGLTIIVMLHYMHIQHAHIHKIESKHQIIRSNSASSAVSSDQQIEDQYTLLSQMPQDEFAALMQRVYFRRSLGIRSAQRKKKPGLKLPRPLPVSDVVIDSASNSVSDTGVAVARHPRGSDDKLLVLGVCTNIHNADSPMYVNYNKWALHLWSTAFPERKVVLNHLGKKCFENERSSRTQIKSDYPLSDTDAIMVTWNNFDDSFRKPIREWRNLHTNEAKTGRDGLMILNGGIPCPHTKDRPLMVADNTETWAQTNKDHDIIIEAISRHSNWGSTNVWWPVASRDFSSERYRLPSQTADDLVVPADYKPPTDDELATREFCAFMFSKCEWYQYKMDAMVRTAFFDTLKDQYKPALAIGGCRKNEAARKKYHVQSPGENYWISSVKTYRKFKFVIAFENKFMPGYWTEKMLNAVLANSIPIYAGSTPELELVTEGLVNPKRFIYCYFNMTKADASTAHNVEERLKYDEANPDHRIESIKKTNPDDLKRCVDKVRAIDQDNDAYRRMISEPIIPGNKVEGSIYEVHTIGAALRRAIALHKSYLVPQDEIDRETAIADKFELTKSWP